MGSGSSKAKNLRTVQKAQDLSANTSVANVNKLQAINPTKTENQAQSNNFVSEQVVKTTDSDSRQILQPDEKNKYKKDKNIHINNVNGEQNDNPSGLLFEDDSDLDQDIDEVLKIPIFVDKSKKNREKEKKMGQKRNKEPTDFGKVHELSTNATNVSTDSEVPVPETYAQRLQRKQYKLQKNFLLHDKETVRNPSEWQQESDDDFNTDSQQMGFDATKFRAANRGRDLKKDLFSTESHGMIQTSHYLQTSEQNFDDFEFKTRQDVSVIRHLPHYDQSEMDLMKQLEDEIL